MQGFKSFNAGLVNNYGVKFSEGSIYSVNGPIVFGVAGNGFHLCKNIEDTFRYSNPNRIDIARVTGFGDYCEGFDDYNGYYDMYSFRNIRIDKVLSREEIIREILTRNEYSMCRFISTGFVLNEAEISLIRSRFPSSDRINNYIEYYCYGNLDAFKVKPEGKRLIKS